MISKRIIISKPTDLNFAAVDGKHYATYTVRCSPVPVGSGVTHGGHIVCYVVVTKVESKVSFI